MIFKILFKAFKLGIAVNILSLILLITYIYVVEYYARPFNFKLSIQLGTIVTGYRIYDSPDSSNYHLRPAWATVRSKFDLFVPEYQLRSDWKQPAPRLQKWCKSQNCCAHRLGFNDARKRNFKCFTLDDWYISNRDFLGSDLHTSVTQSLDTFLRSLPKSSRVIVSEPFVLFADRRSFASFTQWLLVLAEKHPQLRFEIGVQVHLQWVDNYWFQYHGWLFPALGEFSRQHRIAWGISEFSIYDRIWKRRLSFSGSVPDRAKFSTVVESLVPDRFRRAVVLQQAYSVHRDCVRYGCSFLVEWGNFPTLWFSDRIDSDYRSTFALFDWQGNPQPMYWAIVRGIADGERFRL